MSEQQSFREPRFRVSASVTAKGVYQIEGTVEMSKVKQNISDPNDISNVTEKTIGEILLEMLKETEKAFRADGRKLAGDVTA